MRRTGKRSLESLIASEGMSHSGITCAMHCSPGRGGILSARQARNEPESALAMLGFSEQFHGPRRGKMHIHRIRLFAAAILAALSFGAGAQTVKVGVVLPYTGVGAEFGQQVDRGMQMF